jgi:hypothetical protein
MNMPEVGDMVWVYPSEQEGIAHDDEKGGHIAGIITYVHTPEKVNVHVFDIYAQARSLGNVPYFGTKPHQDPSFTHARPKGV